MGMQVGGGGGDDLNSEINVTPFVDVMLVLLVIFMIAAPMMNAGVDLTLPQTEAQSIASMTDKLILSIDKNRGLTIDANKKVTWVDLEDSLRDRLAKDPIVQRDREIYIQADQDLPYHVVVTAMALARKSGLQKVMLLTDATQETNLQGLDNSIGATPSP
jgi:biopolymer transport protein TolR